MEVGIFLFGVVFGAMLMLGIDVIGGFVPDHPRNPTAPVCGAAGTDGRSDADPHDRDEPGAHP